MKSEKVIFSIENEGRGRENLVFCSSKGQMFIIASILILTGLIAMKNLLGVYGTYEEKRFEETFILDRQAENIKGEMRYMLGIATAQADINASGIRFLYNFSNFTTHDVDAKLLYTFIFVNITDQTFGIAVGNFLNDAINITVNATDSTPTGYVFSVNNSANVSSQFQSNVNGVVNITLAYSVQNDNVTEKFAILASTQRYAGLFYDIMLESKDEFVRSKSFYNRTW